MSQSDKANIYRALKTRREWLLISWGSKLACWRIQHAMIEPDDIFICALVLVSFYEREKFRKTPQCIYFCSVLILIYIFKVRTD